MLDSLLFIDEKDLFIDQWFFKMQGKFEINWDHYPSETNKLIYAENKVENKVLQHLKSCLQPNFINFFTTINNFFNYLEDIFGNFHQKKYTREKL